MGPTSICHSVGPSICLTVCSDWRGLNPWSYRKGLGYQLRSQDDYRDVFHLRKFAGEHSDWKPFLAHMLGFDDQLVSLHYEKEKQLEDKKAVAETIKNELGWVRRRSQQDRRYFVVETAGI